jgi:lipoate-protein ligase A
MDGAISVSAVARPGAYSFMLDSAESGLALEKAAADELARVGGAAKQLIWRAPRALVVTRSDTRLPRFAEAAQALRARGWPVLVRGSGGGACPIGPGTVQCVLTRAEPPGATSIEEMYGALAEWIQAALEAFGISSRLGPVREAYCPGGHEIIAGQRKLAGMAQHWRAAGTGRYFATAAASINVEDDPEILASVVNDFYRLAGGSYRCVASATTSVRAQLASTGREPDDLMSACIGQLYADAPT